MKLTKSQATVGPAFEPRSSTPSAVQEAVPSYLLGSRVLPAATTATTSEDPPANDTVIEAAEQQSAAPTAAPTAYYQPTLNTVPEVWKEWAVGINGGPAVSTLDNRWGISWRRSTQVAKWFSRRKVIWDKVRSLVAAGHHELAAVEQVERLRDGQSLNQLLQTLKREGNQEETEASRHVRRRVQ